MPELDNKANLLEKDKLNSVSTEIKAYKRRWIVLFIFMVYEAINSYQWIEYSIITNIATRYYNVSPVTVDWTSIVYMALYAPLIIPVIYIVDKKGLRFAGLFGVVGTLLGTGIKVLSIERDRFWVVLFGQTILAVSQLFILCLPPRIAVVWFKASEVSTACSLGVFGNLMGLGCGYLLTPIFIKNHENIEDVGAELNVLNWVLTACMIPSTLAVIFYFPNAPPKPPNKAQVEERNNSKKLSLSDFFKSIKSLLINMPFVIHVIAFGLNMGVTSAFGTLLNQFILQYFENATEDAGQMGLVMVVAGMFGTVVFGIIMDRTHKYKECAVFSYAMAVVCMIAFIFALELKSKLLVYIAIAALGIFISGYIPIGFELGMELTYPSPETSTSGLLMAPSQILGVFFALIAGKLNALFGTFWAIAFQAILLAVGTIITALVPNKLRRQEAFRKGENVITNIIVTTETKLLNKD